MGANLRSKGQGHWERKLKSRFLLISLSKEDRYRFSSNRDQHDHRPILRIIFDYISPSEMLRFCDICL